MSESETLKQSFLRTCANHSSQLNRSVRGKTESMRKCTGIYVLPIIDIKPNTKLFPAWYLAALTTIHHLHHYFHLFEKFLDELPHLHHHLTLIFVSYFKNLYPTFRRYEVIRHERKIIV